MFNFIELFKVGIIWVVGIFVGGRVGVFVGGGVGIVGSWKLGVVI